MTKVVGGKDYDYQCQNCKSYYKSYGVKDTIYFVNIGGDKFGPFCEKCANNGINFNIVFNEVEKNIWVMDTKLNRFGGYK